MPSRLNRRSPRRQTESRAFRRIRGWNPSISATRRRHRCPLRTVWGVSAAAVEGHARENMIEDVLTKEYDMETAVYCVVSFIWVRR